MVLLRNKAHTPRSPISDSSPSSRIFRSLTNAQTYQEGISKASDREIFKGKKYLQGLPIPLFIKRQMEKDVVYCKLNSVLASEQINSTFKRGILKPRCLRQSHAQ